MKTQDFIEKMASLAMQDMEKSGVLASVTLAQGILESAWGESELAVNANNLFGMKAQLSGNTWPGSSWDGSKYRKDTGEQKQTGEYYTETADFRKYQSLEDSVADHSAYLVGAMNGSQLRYAGLKGEKDARAAITIIKNGGYATSLEYVNKVMNIVESYDLTKYDSQAAAQAAKSTGIKIMLDAGHYGKYNRSPAVNAFYESDFTWKFHLLLKAALEKHGIAVGTTRGSQANDLTLQSRGQAAAGYNLFISIHSNAVGSGVNDAVDYPLAITMVNDDSATIDEESKAVGEVLAQAVAMVMKTKQAARTSTKKSANDRNGNGILDDEYYGVLHGAKIVGTAGIILEHSFHTNTAATTWLLSDNNLAALAEAEAEALVKHYGINAQQPTQDNQVTAQTATGWYRVRKTWEDNKSQVGAYKVLENAVKDCPEGYSVFDEAGKAIYSNAAVLYEVKKGDTLGKIAKEYGSIVDTIVAANKATYPKITANYIVVGWKLKV